MNFNPRTPCGVRLAQDWLRPHAGQISIHAPRVGCDSAERELSGGAEIFQSTHPVWGATVAYATINHINVISIHAPRVGCDLDYRPNPWQDTKFQSTHPVWGATEHNNSCPHLAWDFNPRTPCGVRRPSLPPSCMSRRISIHAPRVGCDVYQAGEKREGGISIHAPRVGCDARIWSHPSQVLVFQSTHPVWGATRDIRLESVHSHNFNPRTPCGVRPVFPAAVLKYCLYFNPRTPCGVRLLRLHTRLRSSNFNPRTPCGVRPLADRK